MSIITNHTGSIAPDAAPRKPQRRQTVDFTRNIHTRRSLLRQFILGGDIAIVARYLGMSQRAVKEEIRNALTEARPDLLARRAS